MYRPLRGWASAYQPEPSLWSRISSGFGKIFGRKKRDEATQPELEEEPIQVETGHEELLVVDETPLLDAVPGEPIEAGHSDELEQVERADTPSQELEFIAEAVEEAESAQAEESETDEEIAEEYHEHFDAAFDAPRSPVTFPAIPETPVVRDYELRGGEEVSDIPVVRDYQLHANDEEYSAEPQDIPARSLLDDEPEERKPGFFARLFGFGRKPKPVEVPVLSSEALQEPVTSSEAADLQFEPEPPVISSEARDLLFDTADPSVAEPAVSDVEEPQDDREDTTEAPRLDRPSIEFFMRVDRASDETEHVPSLDDALPMDDALDAPLAAEGDVGEPTQPWIDAIPEPVVEERKPGFFARLFGRKKQTPDPLVADPALGEIEGLPQDDIEAPAISSEARDLEFAFEPEPVTSEPMQEFASVEDALPVEEPVDAPAAEPVAADPFFFDAPAPPAGFDRPIGDSRSTLEMEPVQPVDLDLDSTLETGPPAAETDSRSTVQVSPMEDEITTGEMVPPVAQEVTAAQEAERPPFFVPKFRAFYNEIVSHKHQKAEFTAGFATAVMDYTADLTPDAAAQQLQKRLSEILELQAAEASWMGGEAASRFPDAQYAMAALADEVFSHLDWAGKEAWPRYLVEQKLFKSNAKDIEFFRRVDRLLKNEAEKPSAAAKDLARMYLLVLAAGFQGKYRPFGLTRPLAEYRRRLYEFVSGKDPLLIYSEERKLFPESAERVEVGRAVSRFSMLQQWAAVLVILLIGYAVISQMAWNRVSADLKDVTARVEAANSSATSDGLAGDPR
ncbi:MAG TPA: DotU family type IV/VI secretion system protein [Gemmatimonadaceae bacterium]|nr:DotU family type IV/VI secretion system protein [Gemmatimonadaceae bacterium]